MTVYLRCLVVGLVACAAVGCGGDGSGTDDGSATGTASPTAAGPTPSGAERASASATPLGSGELIVFERVVQGVEDRDLLVLGPDGGEPRLLRKSAQYPHWSPDGSELAFTACLNPPDCTTALALLSRSTGEVRGFPGPDPELFTSCAIWAPSGKELACGGLSEGDASRNGVYTVRASDAQGLTRITKNPGGEDAPLAFSPDGSQLLFNRQDPSRAEATSKALFVAPTGGGEARRITPWGVEDDYASWSQDGRTIVFGTSGALYRVSPEGQGLAKIPLQTADPTTTRAFDVSFSADGGESSSPWQ